MAKDPTVPLETLPSLLTAGPRLIGLDLGTKTIGLALSDVARGIATPMQTLAKGKFSKDVEALKAICIKQGVGGLVFGLPLNMDGSEGPRAQATRSFVRNLAPIIGIPISYWDERLSTVAVTRTLLEADTSRSKRAEAVDKMAAAFILQGALDRLRAIGRAASSADEDRRD